MRDENARSGKDFDAHHPSLDTRHGRQL